MLHNTTTVHTARMFTLFFIHGWISCDYSGVFVLIFGALLFQVLFSLLNNILCFIYSHKMWAFIICVIQYISCKVKVHTVWHNLLFVPRKSLHFRHLFNLKTKILLFFLAFIYLFFASAVAGSSHHHHHHHPQPHSSSSKSG